MFSPDDKYIVTSAGASAKGGKGQLMILTKQGLKVVKTLEMEATPVKVFWHSKINQVNMALRLPTIILISLDRNWVIERADQRAVFAIYLTEWSEIADEQGTTTEGSRGGYVGRAR